MDYCYTCKITGLYILYELDGTNAFMDDIHLDFSEKRYKFSLSVLNNSINELITKNDLLTRLRFRRR